MTSALKTMKIRLTDVVRKPHSAVLLRVNDNYGYSPINYLHEVIFAASSPISIEETTDVSGFQDFTSLVVATATSHSFDQTDFDSLVEITPIDNDRAGLRKVRDSDNPLWFNQYHNVDPDIRWYPD